MMRCFKKTWSLMRENLSLVFATRLGSNKPTVKVPNFEHFSVSFLKTILVLGAGIQKMLVRIANREDPDQTASSEAVWSGSALFV